MNIEQLALDVGVPLRWTLWPPTFKNSRDFTDAQLAAFAAAVRREALEEAARACEQAIDPHVHEIEDTALRHAAMRIRALEVTPEAGSR